jgi:hypothetical protein
MKHRKTHGSAEGRIRERQMSGVGVNYGHIRSRRSM